MTVATASSGDLRATRSTWLWWRWVLAGVWVALAAAAMPFVERAGTLDEVYAATAAGRVDSVRLTEGLPPGATGYVAQDVVWRDGPFLRRATVVVASPGEHPPAHLGERTTDDVAAQLRQRDPDVRVVPAARERRRVSIYGWDLPGWVGTAAVLHTLLTLSLLVAGPEPWRATRWAWFWLLTPPIGSILFLLLSGPTPGLPRQRRTNRRLTGGWAFLSVMALQAVFSNL